jgi:DNA (cytosine-5)-methyltransferase 1
MSTASYEDAGISWDEVGGEHSSLPPTSSDVAANLEALIVLDLFSGIGGFSLGLERTGGFRTAAFCEIAARCRHLLKHHWPEVRIYDDVCTLTAEQLAADGISVDVICGGFPCQDISFAGAGAGIEGERSGLWREYARLIGELRPRVVIVENVAALTSRGLGVVLGDLALLGYDAEWDRIRAADVGAPHLRARLWIVAYARGEQHEGFGDAFRRALAEGLPEAFHANTSLRSGDDVEADAQHPDPNNAGSHRASLHFVRGSELRDQQDGQPGPMGEDVAHAECGGSQGRPGRWSPGQGRSSFEPAGCGSQVPDADGQRLERCGLPIADERLSSTDPLGRGERSGWPRPRQGGWWSAEPDVGRVAHGVPARVDRLHGLGNAVVPEIPYRLGLAILAARATTIPTRAA